jgi:hypothetical protein
MDWPDFSALGLPAHPSFGFGPGYRGRFASAVLYVLADQESADDLFLARAMCGESGQRFQQWLKAAGISKKYVIVRAIPVNTLGATPSKLNAALDDRKVIAIHKALLAKAPDAKAIVTIGAGAQRLATHINDASLPVVTMTHWTGASSNAGWSQALQTLQGISYPKEGSASFNWDGSRGQIARIDLPFGTLRWQGSSGTRALQAKIGGVASKNYAKIVMPEWAAELDPEPP